MKEIQKKKILTFLKDYVIIFIERMIKMTVGELKNLISKLPDDTRIMIDWLDDELYEEVHFYVKTIENEYRLEEEIVEVFSS